MSDTLWFARHGNREDFIDEAWVRSAERPHDPGLSPDGVQQAQALARRLVGQGISRIFASPYLRTVQTANEVASVLDLPFVLEDGLGEWLNPDWFPHAPVRLSVERLAERYPRIDANYTSVIEPTYPETFEEADFRCGEAARRVRQRYPEGSLLFVGHGVSVTGGVRGFVPDMYVYECGFCSLFSVHENPEGWMVDLCGDCSHTGLNDAASRFARKS